MKRLADINELVPGKMYSITSKDRRNPTNTSIINIPSAIYVAPETRPFSEITWLAFGYLSENDSFPLRRVIMPASATYIAHEVIANRTGVIDKGISPFSSHSQRVIDFLKKFYDLLKVGPQNSQYLTKLAELRQLEEKYSKLESQLTTAREQLRKTNSDLAVLAEESTPKNPIIKRTLLLKTVEEELTRSGIPLENQ